jgi:DNA-binding LytR/AlgR family response regulator
MSLTAIIVDDEPLLRAQLGESLQALWPQLNIVAEADHGEAALDVIATHHPDFVFLDIEMPGISGLDVAAEVHLIAKQTHIVFVTAYDQYAIDAFEQGAIDYLLKPASKARLAKTIARLQSLASRAQPQMDEVLASIKKNIAAHAGPQTLQWIHASRGAQTTIISVEDVVYFQSDSKYTRVVLRTGGGKANDDKYERIRDDSSDSGVSSESGLSSKSGLSGERDHLIRLSLTELVEKLDPNQFRQIQRSAIVNLKEVQHVTKDEFGNLALKLKGSGSVLKVTRNFAHIFKTM